MTRGQVLGWRQGTAAVALAALTGAALAQAGGEGGPLLTFGIQTGLRHDSNLDLDAPSQGGSTALDTGLSFGLRTETQSQKLALDLSGTWRLLDGPDGYESKLDSPRLSLRYDREGARSRLSLQASHAESDLGLLLTGIGIDPDTGDLIVSTATGRQKTTDLGLHFETGIDMPLGLVLDARHLDRRYDDSGANADNRTDSLTARLRLTFSPVLEGGLTLDTSRYRADDADATRRHTDGAALSLQYEIDAATRLAASLGQSRIVTDTLSGTEPDVEGMTAALSLTRDMVNGSAGIAYDRSLSASGTRDSLNLSRALELPRGSLAFSLGASRGESGDIGTIGSLDYALDLKRGAVTLALTRSIQTDNDANDVLETRLSAGWQHELTELSAVRFNVSYARVENGGAGNVDAAQQADLTLAYEHQLTRDWALSTGYEYRTTRREGRADANSNALFLTIGREFSIRP